MRVTKHTKACRDFVDRYLGRAWKLADGLSEAVVKKAETRLGFPLPSALRSFFLSVGAVPELCSIHNIIFHPKDLEVDEGYLIFMDENQSVVSWGIKKNDLKKADPNTWQRNNSSDQWYSEDNTFLQLLASMFDWYKQLGVWRFNKPDG